MISIPGDTLYKGFLAISGEACAYLGQWTFDTPLVVSADTNARMHRLQQLHMQCIRYFVEHYDDYRALMPVSDKIYDILSLCKRKPYRIGAYRTDFVIDERNQFKLVESNCRFALDGFFLSGFYHRIAEHYLADKPWIGKIDGYTAFFDCLMDYFGDFDHVCFLKGEEGRNDTKYIIPIFEQAGFPVHLIPAAEIADNVALFKRAAVIGEVNHAELCRLPLDTIAALIDANMLNDLRTIFLIHDKRFFTLLHDDAFLHAALSEAEVAEFRPYLIPTYTRRLRPDLWEQAREEKDAWLIKPCVLGKSMGVFAGCVTDTAAWRQLLATDELDSVVLQPFITQRKFRGTLGGQAYDDYVVGTLLFFEDQYFGPGLFRASSYPVINKVDDRKFAPLVTADTQYFPDDLVL